MSEHDLSRRRSLARPRFLVAVGVGAFTVGTPAAALATASLAAGGPAAITLHPNVPNVPLHGGFGSQGPGANAKPGSSGSSAVGWASANWSGYAETSSASAPYTGITGNWSVPSVKSSTSSTYSAAWAGIDGFNNNSLIQTGTEQDYYNGAAHYAAWWTTSAQNFSEQVITSSSSGCTSGSCGTVTPGDRITAVITETNTATSTWSITLSNGSTSHPWSFTKLLTYTGPRASAEWIMEAPTVGGRIAPLAQYSPSVFDPGSVAFANGAPTSPSLTASEGGEMVQGSHRFQQVVSIPSLPDSELDGFAINYGSVAPSPPPS